MEENITPSQPIETPVKPAKSWLKIVLFSILGLILATGLVFAGIQIGKKQTPSSTAQPSQIVPTPTLSKAIDWKTYKSKNYKIEFKYPQDYQISENSLQLEIHAPVSKCNPKIIWNIEEYEFMREMEIFVREKYLSLDEALEKEGGVQRGWERADSDFNGKKAYKLIESAEMITPRTRYLIATSAQKLIEIESFSFSTIDEGNCAPSLSNKDPYEILSTFKFLE